MPALFKGGTEGVAIDRGRDREGRRKRRRIDTKRYAEAGTPSLRFTGSSCRLIKDLYLREAAHGDGSGYVREARSTIRERAGRFATEFRRSSDGPRSPDIAVAYANRILG